MMSYVFLILVFYHGWQIVPMSSMEQCKAAIKAMQKFDQDGSWYDDPFPATARKCIEVKQ